MRKCFLILLLIFTSLIEVKAQFVDSSSGLLQMPSGRLYEESTLSITNLYINKHALSTKWTYDTFSYGFSYTFWSRLEVGYVLTVFVGKWDKTAKTYQEKNIVNQDRHFTGRLQILKEGDFGLNWLPNIVVGMSDPATSFGDEEGYGSASQITSGNGYFNRTFAVASKEFNTAWGPLEAHIGYQYNRRKDYRINGPCAALSWKPMWLHNQFGFLNDVKAIFEYDSRTPNIGFIASMFSNKFEAMFEVQNFRWINFGLRYNLKVK